MYRTCAAACALLLAACATESPPRANSPQEAVKTAREADVARCAALPDLVVSAAQPAQTGMVVAQSIDGARRALLARARDAGATHVVWGQELVGFGGTVVTARAYRCDPALVAAR